MPGFVRSFNGTSIRQPAVLSGWTSRRLSAGILVKRFKPTTIFRSLVLFRMSGCVVVRCVVGCRKVMPVDRSTRLRPAAAPGVPKSRINIEDFRLDYEAFSATLPDEYFPKGSDWLSLGPTGPRRLRLAVEHLAQYRGGICFMVDLDPRWVIKLLKMGQPKMAEQYKQHVIEQGLTLLRAHDNIRCLFTTPKLLEALCEKVSLKKLGITGVFCGGTEMTPQFHRFAVEELLEGAYFAPTYGNTLMGLAVHKPRDAGRQLRHHLLSAAAARDD